MKRYNFKEIELKWQSYWDKKKTFKTITSITPSANTAGSITMGFTGAGITTTGGTGTATLDNV